MIHNLPAGSSINENSKTEYQLYTINVTDDSANDVITCYIQKTTPQMNDFYVRRTSLDTYGELFLKFYLLLKTFSISKFFKSTISGVTIFIL